MADVLKKNDFVEIDFIGKFQESGEIFDTTLAAVAKTAHINREEHVYRPIVICIGQGDVVLGLDAFLEGKEVGATITVPLSCENAFGKKNPKLIKLIPTSNFTKAQVRPVVGLTVSVDEMYGIIKTVTGGRTIVDFNHPLAGKDVTYEVTLRKKVTDVAEQLSSFLSFQLKMNKDAFHVHVTGDKAHVKTHFVLPKEIAELINQKAYTLIQLKEITYEEEKEHMHQEENKHTH